MKNVWKLVRNFIILAIPLIVMCVYTFFCPMYFMATEYSMWQEEKEYVKGGEDADVLILGDSRAKSGIIPELLMSQDDPSASQSSASQSSANQSSANQSSANQNSENGNSDDHPSIYNAAIGGATPIEMYYAFETYLKNHRAPEKVILIFAPYHMCDIDNWEQTLYYNYLSVPQEMKVYCEAVKLGEEKVAYKWAPCSMLSYKLRLPNKFLSAQYNAGFFRRYDENIKKKNTVIADKGYTVFGTDNGNSGLSYEVHHKEFDYSELVVSYYKRLLELMEKSGTKVYIIQSPVNTESFEKITPEFKEGYADMLNELTEGKDFYVETELFPYDNKYFGDNNHLNRSGAEVFSSSLKWILE